MTFQQNVPPPQPPKVFQPPKGGEVIPHADKSYFMGNYIGGGAFAQVYECWDDWGNALVAKVITPQNRSYDQVKADWGRELQNLVALRHPNITFIYDAFEYRDTFYLIIERCHSTLAELIQMKGLQGDLWVPHVARAVLQAIQFLHLAGIVHKDLHAGNIFMLWQRDTMVPNREPVLTFKVGDLGISRLERDIDVFNTILARWMVPPEFLAPQSFGQVGKQVDVYHAALLFLSLLLGHIPVFTDQQIVNGEPRRLAESLGSPYAPAISRALRRTVVHRTQSAIGFWHEIRAAVPLSQTS